MTDASRSRTSPPHWKVLHTLMILTRGTIGPISHFGNSVCPPSFPISNHKQQNPTMDGALSSDRHDNNRRHDHHSHGGGGRGRGRGGRNFNNRRHHPYRRDDYGGGRHNRHHNERRYDRDNRGGHRGGRGGSGGQRRDRQPANRFSTETKSVDPQYAMMKQLTAMVAKMGDLGGAADVAGAGNEGSVDLSLAFVEFSFT